MTNTRAQLNQKLKPYQILLIGMILTSLLILNSIFINNQKSKDQLYEEKSKLFDKIISIRNLNEGNSKKKTSDDVCKLGSKELVDYYKTGDLSKIEIEEGKIKCKESEEGYFKALLNIVTKLVNEKGKSNSSRSLEENKINLDEVKDDAITYGKHIIPIFVFVVIAILSIPGWLICCFCCCCDCCCCCCCKKPGCKIPCFIFTYIFYALSVVVCIYGLSKTSHVFIGIADTECSVLKFFDEILDGEMKQDKPRWAGINGINGILDDLTTQINELSGSTKRQADNAISEISVKKKNFVDDFVEVDKKFYSNYPTEVVSFFSRNYNLYSFTSINNDGTSSEELIDGTYVLDIIKMLGKYDSEAKRYKPDFCFLDFWQREYELVAENADEYLEIAKSSFDTILDSKSEDIKGYLNQGKDMLTKIQNPIDDIKSSIADNILQNYESIENYGKTGSKLVFTVLGLMNIALAVLVLLICFCSGKSCTNCCCCRCIFKFFTHLLWNILALLMIITFLVGSSFTLVGTVGYDAMSLISYAVSEENLKSSEPFLGDYLVDVKKYLDICINGDGNLEEAIGFKTDEIGSFDNITIIQEQIREAEENFTQMKDCKTYGEIGNQIEGRYNLEKEELMLVKENEDYPTSTDDFDMKKHLLFKYYLEGMNTAIQSYGTDDQKKESWSTTTDNKNMQCPSSPSPVAEETEFYPSKCKPIDRDWINCASTDINIKGRAQIISDTIDLLSAAKDENDGVLKKLEPLKDKYLDFLDQYLKALSAFRDMIDRIIGNLKQYINKDKGGLFGFINGKFIGTNLKIILKYLKSALGTDVKTIGMCLLIVGCSLALSISSTILLIIVINADIENNKKMEQIPEYKLNSVGRVYQY